MPYLVQALTAEYTHIRRKDVPCLFHNIEDQVKCPGNVILGRFLMPYLMKELTAKTLPYSAQGCRIRVKYFC